MLDHQSSGKIETKIKIGHLLLALSLCFLMGSAAMAQKKDTKTEHKAAKKTKMKPTQLFGQGDLQDRLNYQTMKTPPKELPAMSAIAPSGAIFEHGYKSVDVKGVTQVQLHYKTTMDAASVLSSYAQQFKQPGWQLVAPTNSRVSGLFGRNSCVVQVTPNRAYNELTLLYQFHQ